MIIKAKNITEWLANPNLVNDEELENLQAFIQEYPYFVPPHFINTSLHWSHTHRNVAVLDHFYLYQTDQFSGLHYLETHYGKMNTFTHPEVSTAPNFETTISQPSAYENSVEATPIATQEPVADIVHNNLEKAAKLPLNEAFPHLKPIEALINTESILDAEKTTHEMEFPTKLPLSEEVAEATPQHSNIEPIKEEQSTENTIQAQEEKTEDLETKEVVEESVREPLEVETPIVTSNHFTEINATVKNKISHKEEETLITPTYSDDYFLHQGIAVSNDIPVEMEHAITVTDDPKSLMVMMSFSEWLHFFSSRNKLETEENKDKKSLKTMWQKEKLAAAMEEENEEIPEAVFEMAVNSISKEENLISESLAKVLEKQGKWEQAIEMYNKLILHNPQKNHYFADQIKNIQKNTTS